MAAVKKIKKAQAGIVTEKKLRPSAISVMTEQFKGKKASADTSVRGKAIKSGKFREDLKSGDLFPVKKKSGGSLKPVAADQKGLSKLPTPVRNKMGYQKSGGKTKAKCMSCGGKMK